MRFSHNDFGDGKFHVAAIRFPRQSVNRARFSDPEDVLFDENGRYNGLGVVELRVDDIPESLVGEQGSTYVFGARHEPLADNYAHSDICSAKSAGGDGQAPSKSVKLQFRIRLSQRVGVERIRIQAATNRA